LIHLIEEIQLHEGMKLSHAVQAALKQVIGAYAIVVLDKNDPDTIVAAKKGSPMVIGIGSDDFFIASDASPIIEYTKNVVYLEDEQVAVLRRDQELKIRNLKDKEITPYVQELTLELESIEKGGYDHFMLKEIYEQPRSVLDSMRGRLQAHEGVIRMGGIEDHENDLVNITKKITKIAYIVMRQTDDVLGWYVYGVQQTETDANELAEILHDRVVVVPVTVEFEV